MTTSEDSPRGAPEWFVSFADMMTLLLTFFIMLVSFSEPKKDDKFNAVIEQLQKQFGKHDAPFGLASGGIMARQSVVARGVNLGRAKRSVALQGDSRTAGGTPHVRLIRTGTQTAIGATIFFDEGSTELNERARGDIRAQASQLLESAQKIEIRGHCGLRPVEAGSRYDDNWELAYQRGRTVMRYLVDELNLEAARIRLSVAGPNEPLHFGADPLKMGENPRVELYLLEEVVSDFSGTAEEREQQFSQPGL